MILKEIGCFDGRRGWSWNLCGGYISLRDVWVGRKRKGRIFYMLIFGNFVFFRLVVFGIVFV